MNATNKYQASKADVEAHIPEDAIVMMGISGGKDSLVLLDLYVGFREKMVYVNVITPASETSEEHFKYLTYLCDKYDIKIHIIEEEDNMEEYIIQRELHTPDEPYALWDKILKCGSYIDRAAHSIIGHNDYYRLFGNTLENAPVWLGEDPTLYRGDNYINPLYNTSGEDSLEYIEEKGLELHPIYSKGFNKNTKIPCFLWIEDSDEEFERNIELMKKHYPEDFKYWVEWENTNGFPFFRGNDKVKWMRDYDTEDSIS